MENLSDLFVLGSVVSGIKLLWALTVPVIIYMICRKIRAIAPVWIIYSLIFVAFANLHNVVPVILSRMLSSSDYSYIMLFSNILNGIGAITFITAVFGMASLLEKQRKENTLK